MAAPNPAAATSDHPTDKTEVTINVDELLRTRDQLVTGLSSISAAIHEFVRSYVQHTNRWLGADTLGVPAGLDLASMANLFNPGDATGLNALTDAKGKRKKRARKEKDPNAPKRPLTPFFLYSMNARAIVKEDMGAEATSAEINAEILRRWNVMVPTERQQWKDLYDANAQVYRDQKAAYDVEKAGKLAEAEAAGSDDDAHGGADSDDADASDADKAPTPPPAPKPRTKAAAKPKKAAAEPAAPSAKQSAVPLPGTKATSKRKADDKTAAPAAAAEEPKKKRARKSKAADEGEKSATAAPKETAAQKKRKKKSDAGN